MKVPAGMKVYSGTHRYKAGEELPAHIGKNLEKKLDKTTLKQASFKKDKDDNEK